MEGDTINNTRNLILQTKRIKGISATQLSDTSSKTSVEPNPYAQT